MIEVRPTIPADIAALAATMRDADRLEIVAFTGQQPGDALVRCVEVTPEPYTGLVSGKVAVILGVHKPIEWRPEGEIWLLSGTAVDEARRAVARATRDLLPVVGRGYLRLGCWCDTRHTLAHKWLAWLGFRNGQVEPLGVNGETFTRFTLE